MNYLQYDKVEIFAIRHQTTFNHFKYSQINPLIMLWITYNMTKLRSSHNSEVHMSLMCLTHASHILLFAKWDGITKYISNILILLHFIRSQESEVKLLKSQGVNWNFGQTGNFPFTLKNNSTKKYQKIILIWFWRLRDYLDNINSLLIKLNIAQY